MKQLKPVITLLSATFFTSTLLAQTTVFPIKEIKLSQAIVNDQRWTCPVLNLDFTIVGDEEIAAAHVHQELIGYKDDRSPLNYWNPLKAIVAEDGSTVYRRQILLLGKEDTRIVESGRMDLFVHTKTHGYNIQFDITTQTLRLQSAGLIADQEAKRNALMKIEDEQRRIAYEREDKIRAAMVYESDTQGNKYAVDALKKVQTANPNPLRGYNGTISNYNQRLHMNENVLVYTTNRTGETLSYDQAKRKIQAHYGKQYSSVALTKQSDGSTLIIGIP